MGAVPDGYERWPDRVRGPGLRLIDPTDCPGGHAFKWGTRQSIVHCDVHGTHNSWRCRCGLLFYRGIGEFVTELECVG